MHNFVRDLYIAGTNYIKPTIMKADCTFSHILNTCLNLDEAAALPNAVVLLHGLTFFRVCSNGTLPPFQFPTHTLEAISNLQIPVYAVATTGCNLSFVTAETDDGQLAILKQQFSHFATVETETNTDVCLIRTHTADVQPLIQTLKDIPLLMLSAGNGSLAVAIRQANGAETMHRAAAYIFGQTQCTDSVKHIVQNDSEAFLSVDIPHLITPDCKTQSRD